MNINTTITSYLLTDDYLEINANQTIALNLKIRDDTGNLHTPSILRWQLSDEDGNIINGRLFSVEQTDTDTIILNYDDTTITNEVDKLILSIAAGVSISSVNYQQNSEIEIKLKTPVNIFPQLFDTTVSDTLDDPFADLDTPFTDLDETF